MRQHKSALYAIATADNQVISSKSTSECNSDRESQSNNGHSMTIGGSSSQTPAAAAAAAILGYDSDNNDDDDNDDDFFNKSYHNDAATMANKRSDGRMINDSQADKAINCSRLMVIFVLLSAAAAVGGLAFITVTNDEAHNFEASFNNHAQEITSLANAQLTTIYTALRTFSILYLSFSTETGATLPFATLQDFEVFGMGSRAITGLDVIAFAPLIGNTNSTVDNAAMKTAWEEYSLEKQGWITRSHAFNPASNLSLIEPIKNDIWYYGYIDNGDIATNTPPQIGVVNETGPGPYSPIWQLSPPPAMQTQYSIVNYNLQQVSQVAKYIQHATMYGQTALSPHLPDFDNLFHNNLFSATADTASAITDETISAVFVLPTYDSFNPTTAKVMGHLLAIMPWRLIFQSTVENERQDLHLVLDNCGEISTFRMDSDKSVFLGLGDFHEELYSDLKYTATLGQFDDQVVPPICAHTLTIYPTAAFESLFSTNTPKMAVSVIFGVFGLAILVFVTYDILVYYNRKKIRNEASKSMAIVGSLFPGLVGEKLFQLQSNSGHIRSGTENNTKHAMFAKKNNQSDNAQDDMPLAELYTDVTVLFADIAGFTAWSSIREPAQVFALLESVFAVFDEVANRMRVFKVETVGDCLVAAVGVPEPRKNHAVVMARFARECIENVNTVLHDLEMTLGPGTADLAMRFGIHSGPVTAGVLRGDRARFQLFGDTMNTAARIESTGRRGLIHMSEQTAALITAAGRGDWLEARKDVVEAKGKGKMKTFWLKTKQEISSIDNDERKTEDRKRVDFEGEAINSRHFREVTRSMSMAALQQQSSIRELKMQRLVDWNANILTVLLKQIVARQEMVNDRKPSSSVSLLANKKRSGVSVKLLDEVVDVIEMPEFDACAVVVDPASVVLPENVVEQLHEYIGIIALMYRQVAFHNFEHASHVAMSVNKILSRLVDPHSQNFVSNENDNNNNKHNVSKKQHLHNATFGIASDPITQFALVLAALIHDVDHRGVPNSRLAVEDKALAATYNQRSIAEQNSLDLAWNTLMSTRFDELRSCIYTNRSEQKRFRQVLINVVIATDIFDGELVASRQRRWNQAFVEPSGDNTTTCGNGANDKVTLDRRATIVIESIMQASDIAHTMQHWHVYLKWNKRLFEEMYDAYCTGRSSTSNPADFWYQGELNFFDKCVIPLTKTLRDCGVFGAVSDEYMNYALDNRKVWVEKGMACVESMVTNLANGETIS